MDKKQQVMNLWRDCFDDNEQFIDLFFSRIYKDENELTIDKEGQVISALQIIPYTMMFWGKEISVGYIYGACTKPQDRGYGHMSHLVNEALQVMIDRETALAITIPATPELFDFYRRAEMTEAFDRSTEEFVLPDVPITSQSLIVMEPEVPDTKQVYEFFDSKLRERNCCVLHSYDDFITIIRDYYLSDGHILAAIDVDEQVKGLAFVKKTDSGEVAVRELVYENTDIKFLLLQEAIKQYGGTKAVYRSVGEGMKSVPFAMAKVLDKERLIDAWLHANKHTGHTKEGLKELDTPSLTHLLLGYEDKTAYLSLMYEE